MSSSIMRSAAILAALTLFASFALDSSAQTKGKGPVRRAQPPKFPASDKVFFDNAFQKGLEGERPGNLGQAAPMIVKGGGGNAPAAGGDVGAGSGWSAIISAGTLENEVKAQKLLADKSVTTPSDFAGNGYKLVRRDFSIAAMVFAIIGEYDGEVRWKKEGPTMRDAIARTAANAKVGTTGVYNEAKIRKEELESLVGGQSVSVKDAEVKPAWGQVCARSPLMQRLEASLDSKIKAWTASKGEFTGNLEALQAEAEIFAAIGAVLTKDGLEDFDNTEYQAFSKALLTGSIDLARACKDKNHDAASKAAGVIATSCDKCHEAFR